MRYFEYKIIAEYQQRSLCKRLRRCECGGKRTDEVCERIEKQLLIKIEVIIM
jgi:hypothetical protein